MSYSSVEYKGENKSGKNKSLSNPHLLSINCKLINEKYKKKTLSRIKVNKTHARTHTHMHITHTRI